MKQDVHILKQRIERLLARWGGFYSFDDIVAAVRRGDMQSFANDDAWVVTQICNYPRKTVLNIVLAAGDIDKLREIHSEVIGFAREHGITTLYTTARDGFSADADERGWERVGSVFIKDLDDGS